MSLHNPENIVQKLRELQRLVRDVVRASHAKAGNATVTRSTSADTIYGIDADVEPVIEAFLEEWSRELPMVVIAEGLEPETGKVFPHGSEESNAVARLILDPIDGTRGIMYDKRPAWSLAGIAENKGDATKLSDIEIAVMTELPTSKMGQADVLWAIKGSGWGVDRESLDGKGLKTLAVQASRAETIAHGFAMISNFFPGTKIIASELMEHIATQLLGAADVNKAAIFEDQYICTGGQFYELIVGHDRFNADLRPAFYKAQGQPEGLCCHPYDCCTLLIANEAGVILTDEHGKPLDGPMDCVTGISWIGYANDTLRDGIEPIMQSFLKQRGAI